MRVASAVALAAVTAGLACANAPTPSNGSPKDAASTDAPTDGAMSSCPEDCLAHGQVCSLGRCTTMPCSDAESTITSIIGCLFYSLQADNVTADEGAWTSFLVTNPGTDRADVALQVASGAPGNAGWSGGTTLVVDAGASVRLPIRGAEVVGTGVTPGAALRISSDRPVMVSEIESDDIDESATSTGGTVLLPLQALGTDYRAVTYPQRETPDVQTTPGSRGGAARLMIVGTHDQTSLSVTVPSAVSADMNGAVPALLPGQPYTLTLDDGDVFQMYTNADGEDLTGTLVTATQPVAVFSGNISTTYGFLVTGLNSADMAHEEMPPLSSWENTYIGVALAPQDAVGCTSFFGIDGASLWRLVADHDGTQVTVSGSGLPGPSVFTLDAGQATSMVAAGNLAITATDRILVTQGVDCEPSLSLAVGVAKRGLFSTFSLAVPPSFDLELGIVRPVGGDVELDGVSVEERSTDTDPSTMFEPVGQGFEVATVRLAQCMPPDGGGDCTHQLTSASGFGMTLRGMDVGSSFALTPPPLPDCPPDVCVAHVHVDLN